MIHLGEVWSTPITSEMLYPPEYESENFVCRYNKPPSPLAQLVEHWTTSRDIATSNLGG